MSFFDMLEIYEEVKDIDMTKLLTEDDVDKVSQEVKLTPDQSTILMRYMKIGKEISKYLNIKYNGWQEGYPDFVKQGLMFFTDPKTHGTFAVKPAQLNTDEDIKKSAAERLEKMRNSFNNPVLQHNY